MNQVKESETGLRIYSGKREEIRVCAAADTSEGLRDAAMISLMGECLLCISEGGPCQCGGCGWGVGGNPRRRRGM